MIVFWIKVTVQGLRYHGYNSNNIVEESRIKHCVSGFNANVCPQWFLGKVALRHRKITTW